MSDHERIARRWRELTRETDVPEDEYPMSRALFFAGALAVLLDLEDCPPGERRYCMAQMIEEVEALVDDDLLDTAPPVRNNNVPPRRNPTHPPPSRDP